MNHYPLHDVRCEDKVNNLTINFNKEKAKPILSLNNGNLINGTHRYSAYVKRMELGCKDNFSIVNIDEYPDCWVMQAIQEYLLTQDDDMYIDIDLFWHENYIFSEYYENK